MTTDLLVNLFAAYGEVPDKQFKGYVQPIQDQHYDARQPQNPNGLTLMTTIENYYKGMVKDGIWMKPDADQETIIALKAHIEAKQHPKSGKARKDWKLISPKPGESRKNIITVNGKESPIIGADTIKDGRCTSPKIDVSNHKLNLNLNQNRPQLLQLINRNEIKTRGWRFKS
jgi:hypothetical protein